MGMQLKTYFENHSQVDLAKALGVTPGAVNQWSSGATAITEGRCIQIETATNGLVRCEDLRPDVNWAVLRNTTPQEPSTTQENTHA
jgi:DNA-binding transcriptional regulator YdaS (Cro superfamily)